MTPGNSSHVHRQQCILLALVSLNIGVWILVSLDIEFDRNLTGMRSPRMVPRYHTARRNRVRKIVKAKVVTLEDDDAFPLKEVGGIGLTYTAPRSLGLTSPVMSSYELVNAGTIEAGGIIQLRIHARDKEGRLRTSGGDFFSVVALQKAHNASTTAHVVDHDNGTYTTHAYAGWAGISAISVTLVHPSDAIQYLRNNYTFLEHKVEFVGVFKGGNRTEKTTCFIQYEGSWERKCEYFHPTNLYSTRLLCDPPETLSCDALTILPRSDDTNALNMPRVPADKRFLFTQERRYQRILRGPQLVTVRGVPDQPFLPRLESCFTAEESNPDAPDGFWFRGRYLSLACDNSRWFSMNHSLECIRDKHLLLLGDSQLRLWIRSLKNLLQIDAHVDKYTHAISMTKPEINFNVTFQFHPFFRHPDDGYSLVADHRYETQILDESDRSHCNYIVVFGPWAHYALWTPGAYKERLEFLRDGILRFMERCPDAVVVLKGPQPTKTTTTFFDYICKRMMAVQREVFSGLGVKYMNVWDMIEAAYWYDDPHPPNMVVNVQFQQLLSYSCQ